MNELIARLEELLDLFGQKYGNDKYAAMVGAQKSVIRHMAEGASVEMSIKAVKSYINDLRNETAAAGPSITGLAADSSTAGGGFLISQP